MADWVRLARSLKLEGVPSRLLFAPPVGRVSGSASPQSASLTCSPLLVPLEWLELREPWRWGFLRHSLPWAKATLSGGPSPGWRPPPHPSGLSREPHPHHSSYISCWGEGVRLRQFYVRMYWFIARSSACMRNNH